MQKNKTKRKKLTPTDLIKGLNFKLWLCVWSDGSGLKGQAIKLIITSYSHSVSSKPCLHSSPMASGQNRTAEPTERVRKLKDHYVSSPARSINGLYFHCFYATRNKTDDLFLTCTAIVHLSFFYLTKGTPQVRETSLCSLWLRLLVSNNWCRLWSSTVRLQWAIFLLCAILVVEIAEV